MYKCFYKSLVPPTTVVFYMGSEVVDERRERKLTVLDATRVDNRELLQIVSFDTEQRLEMERMDCPVITDDSGHVWSTETVTRERLVRPGDRP